MDMTVISEPSAWKYNLLDWQQRPTALRIPSFFRSGRLLKMSPNIWIWREYYDEAKKFLEVWRYPKGHLEVLERSSGGGYEFFLWKGHVGTVRAGNGVWSFSGKLAEERVAGYAIKSVIYVWTPQKTIKTTSCGVNSVYNGTAQLDRVAVSNNTPSATTLTDRDTQVNFFLGRLSSSCNNLEVHSVIGEPSLFVRHRYCLAPLHPPNLTIGVSLQLIFGAVACHRTLQHILTIMSNDMWNLLKIFTRLNNINCRLNEAEVREASVISSIICILTGKGLHGQSVIPSTLCFWSGLVAKCTLLRTIFTAVNHVPIDQFSQILRATIRVKSLD